MICEQHTILYPFICCGWVLTAGLMQSPQIAARPLSPSPSPTRGEGSQISFWCEIPPLPLWERGQGERGFTDFASALGDGTMRLDSYSILWYPACR